MKTKIKIHTRSSGWVRAEIDAEKNPATANKINNSLPISGSTQLWGDEIYFSIPVKIDEENAQVEVAVGDLAYWPPGTSFCIFFGKTPASRGEQPAAASAVNVFGNVLDVPTVFQAVKNGEKITIELDQN